MRSNPAHQLFFISSPENILRSNLNSSTSYGRLIDFKSFSGLLVRFLWLGDKISLTYLLIGGAGPPCPDEVDSAYVQTNGCPLPFKICENHDFKIFDNRRIECFCINDKRLRRGGNVKSKRVTCLE